MKTLERIGMVTIIAAILLGWGSIPRAPAAEFTVTRTDDPFTDGCMPDDCSLREAVIEANNRGGHDTILLRKQVYSLTIPVPQNGDFSFTQVGDLDIKDDVTIKGPTGGGSTRATIDANGATTRDRVFEIHGGADTDVTMRRLFITDGRAHPTGPDNNGDGRPDFAYGGAMLIEEGGALSASGVILDRNTTESMGQGGAIFNDGDLSLVRAQIRFNDAPGGFSGGIQTNPGATISLYDTEVQNNDAIFGGGLGAYGVTTIERSAIATCPTARCREAPRSRSRATICSATIRAARSEYQSERRATRSAAPQTRSTRCSRSGSTRTEARRRRSPCWPAAPRSMLATQQRRGRAPTLANPQTSAAHPAPIAISAPTSWSDATARW
jgi:CSLREA domain-containing protein